MTPIEQEFIESVREGDADRMTALLAQDRGLVNTRTESGESAVLIAMYHNRRGLANLLWDYGAEMNVWDAAAIGAFERVQELILLDPGLIHAHSHDGFSPLQLAAFFGNADVVEWLVTRGADVNGISRNQTFARGVPVLQSAVAGGHVELVRVLLEHGANPNVLNQHEGTPLYVAAANGNIAMVRLLLAHGADRKLKTTKGETALAIAKARGHAQVAALLESEDRV